jgi:EAL domain-containing protein (putative c-di-GMP-specific phosphodiesterase class I)
MKQEDPALFGLWRENVRQAVVINREFYHKQVQKPTFPELIKNIRKSYSDRVIIDGVQSTWEFSVLQDCGIWAVQGYMYRSVPLKNYSGCFNRYAQKREPNNDKVTPTIEKMKVRP